LTSQNAGVQSALLHLSNRLGEATQKIVEWGIGIKSSAYDFSDIVNILAQESQTASHGNFSSLPRA
jgi:hypothetical protein